MNTLETLLSEVRKHYQRANLHQHFNGDMDRVTTAQVALDTAEDTMLALSDYESSGIGSGDGEKYLRLYGFLQAIFLQQYAIKKLHELFVGDFTDPPGISAWNQLRGLRNLTVAHSVEQGQGKQLRRRAFIMRISLETDGFDYQVWHKETGTFSFDRADLSAIYATYKQEVSSMLGSILTGISGAPDYYS